MKTYWGEEDQERLEHHDLGEAIGSVIEERDLHDGIVELHEFKSIEINTRGHAESILDTYLTELDEEYGDPEGDATVPTEKMLEAARALVEVVKSEYEVFMCKRTGKKETVDVREWCEEFHPDWL